MVENVIHTCLWVADMDRTLEFYIDVLGLSKSRESPGSAYQQDVDNVFVCGPDGTEIQFKYSEDHELERPAGMDHIAVSTSDVDGEFERIVDETGCPVIMEPTTIWTGERIAFVEDPDGYAIELVEPDADE